MLAIGISSSVRPTAILLETRAIGKTAALDASAEDHPVSVALPPDYPLVKADFSLMEQVLVNLLLNA